MFHAAPVFEDNLTMREHILADSKVLDLSIWLPGPYCSMILGDLGADVIKVERRLLGDPSRHAHPFVDHQSCHFLTLNRNKKSIALNLKRDEGRNIFLKLASEADVLLESFKPGYVDEIGIGYEDIREVNPKIVYCSLSGYGQTGPYAQRAGHDINYTALGGLLDLTRPSGPPALPSSQIADLSGALFATIGILSALVRREQSGTGTYLDVSMLHSLVSFLSPAAAALLCGRPAPEGYKYLTGQLPCYNVYRTRDGRYMALGAIEPTFWADFCKAIGRQDLIAKQIPDANERESVIAEVQQVFAERTQAAWIEFFADKNVCCEPVNSLAEALEHPQTRHRDMISYVDHPTAGRVGQIGSPIRFSNASDSHSSSHQQTPDQTEAATHDVVSPPPRLGQHTLEIMRELGYKSEDIDRLRQEKVIATPEDTLPPEAFSRRRPQA